MKLSDEQWRTQNYEINVGGISAIFSDEQKIVAMEFFAHSCILFGHTTCTPDNYLNDFSQISGRVGVPARVGGARSTHDYANGDEHYHLYTSTPLIRLRIVGYLDSLSYTYIIGVATKSFPYPSFGSRLVWDSSKIGEYLGVGEALYRGKRNRQQNLNRYRKPFLLLKTFGPKNAKVPPPIQETWIRHRTISII